ncbi:MAG: UvrD-helicase domain-containing protein [Bacteroidales bacterium]|nr:UvrD-helicase domain-containing protein [Bacteroidales bacterium]
MSKLQIYKASAGSGKTYLLTENYLKLSFESPDNFSKILAVTFTNKAAEEMKKRILKELNSIINKGKKANHFKSIANHLNTDSEPFILQRATAVRDQLLHNYSMFFVSTIDSFVQKVVRSFAYEMNLNSGYDIEMDNDKVINDLTEMLYNSISENKDLQKWLIKFAEFKINEGKNWDFRAEINALSQEIFKEKFQSLFLDKKDADDEKKLISDFLNSLYSIKKSFESKMNQISERYKSILVKEGIDFKNLGFKFQSISNHFYIKIPDKKYEDLFKTLIKALEGIENWYKKTEEIDIVNSIKLIYDDLYECIEDFFKTMEKDSESYYSAEVVISNFYSFGILNDVANFLPEYRSNNNILLISDTNLLLRQIIGNNDAPFIYEKFGNRFNNILIDEFQDTSGFQWANFKPMIENSLSQAFYDLIVGDIKQSIYRWRSGDWKLLLSGVKEDIGNNFIDEQSLDYNWRSKKNIILFNNTIFKIIPELLQNQFNNELLTVKNESLKNTLISEDYDKIITQAYKGQKQNVPEKSDKTGGSVMIKFFEKSNNDKYNEKIYEHFPATIDNLLKSGKYKPSDIGILVRRNIEAKDISNILMKYQEENTEAEKYQIVSPDSLYISSSSAIKLLICAMRFIFDKNNDINTAHLIYEYQRIINGNEIDYNKIFLSVTDKTFEKLLPGNYIKSLDALSQKSVYELSESIINIFELYKLQKEFSYLKAFQDIISDQIRRNNSNLSEFLDWWEEKGITKSIQLSEKTDAVQIMTIHKSKGLAFRIVMLPYANWNIDHSGINSPLLWVTGNKPPFNSFKYLPVKYSRRLAQTIYAKDYFNEKLYANIDALNMLYVAFTRAIDELYIFAQYDDNKKSNEIKNIGQLLYVSVYQDDSELIGEERGFIDLKNFTNQNNKIFLFDHKHKPSEHSIPEDEDDIISKLYSPERYPNNITDEKIKIKFSSEEFFIESIDEIEHKVNYGNLMHQIFSEIKTGYDINNALEKMIFEGYISNSEKSELNEKIKEIISRPTVNQWFTDDFEVKNEEALITSKGDIRIPDRVLINDERIIVIDFKFGKKHKKYKRQIEEYKNLLEEVYEQKPEAYIFYVEEDVIETV